MNHVAGRIEGMAAAIGADRAIQEGRVEELQAEMKAVVEAVEGLSVETHESANPLKEVMATSCLSIAETAHESPNALFSRVFTYRPMNAPLGRTRHTHRVLCGDVPPA